MVVLLPFETSFRSLLKKRNVTENTNSFADFNVLDPVIEEKITSFKERVQRNQAVSFPTAEAAWKSFIAHYVKYADKRISGPSIADAARGLAEAMGLKDIPTLPDEISAQLKHRK